jgi:hypothetical protein
VPSITPAPFGYTGGTLRTSRVVPALVTFTTSSIVAGHESPTSTAAVVPVLDRLTVYDKFPGVGDAEWNRFVAIWQDKCEKIEEAFTAINARVDEVALYARLTAVESLAQVANDNAVAAVETAEQVSTAAEQTFAEVDPTYAERYAYWKDYPG